jgi:hypothetical protein
MKGKLIKTEVNYLLEDDKGVVIASTSTKEGINGLSKQNCDEIFGVVDVDGLARKWRDNSMYRDANAYSYKAGFNKAMELNRFTLEDIRKAYYVGYEDGKSGATFFQQLIQSLQQPTEIDVVIDMECLDPNCDGINKKGVCIPGDKPKLDPNGCLILKKL